MFLGGLFQHAGQGLAAIALVVADVRAVVESVDLGASAGELLFECFVNLDDQGFGEEIASYTRLIGDHDHGQAGAIESADGARGVREDFEAADVVGVALFFDDGAVTIEKNGGAGLIL